MEEAVPHRKILRFEDLQAWQKAREFAAAIYEVTQQEGFAKDFGLKDQIRRASVSVMSYIAEGYERRGQVEFSRFLTIAKASAAESRSLLYVALDVGYIDPIKFDRLHSQSIELTRITAGLRVAVERRIANEQPRRPTNTTR